MDLELAERTAVVLASTRGLGLAAARALLEEGARVALSGRDRARLSELERELGARYGERVFVQEVDVGDLAALERHLADVRERFGGLHVLVTNSGGPRPTTAAELDGPAVEAAVRPTLAFAVHAIHTVLPWMRAERHGRIIALTSSTVRQPMAGLALSNSLRAGLTGYLKTLASEVAAEGITVNSITTGMFDTDRLRELLERRARDRGRSVEEERAALLREIPAGRTGHLEEFGALVAFLASERAAFITGVALPIDGGASRGLF